MNTVLVTGSRTVPAYGSRGGFGVEAFARFTGRGLIGDNALEGVDDVCIDSAVDVKDIIRKDASWTTFDIVALKKLSSKEGALLSLAEIKVQNLRAELYQALTSNVSEVVRNQAIEYIYRRLRGV